MGDEIAFVTVYRGDDAEMQQLTRGCLGPMVLEGGAELDAELLESRVRDFGACLVLELVAGEAFEVTGPVETLEPELREFAKELLDMPGGGKLALTDGEGLAGLPEGVTGLRLSVPPVFRSRETGDVFPLFFRRFRDGFAQAARQLAFEFLRLQTRSEFSSFRALGPRDVDEVSLQVDRELTAVSEAYRFLLLVAPVNLAEIRETFFGSRFTNVPEYRYRLLPVDPDVLKRRLFNIRIEDVDDPALSILFREKREEIDHELTMLAERGTRNFFYTSIRRYRGVDPEVLAVARELCEKLPEVGPQEAGEKSVTAQEFAQTVRDEFNYFRQQQGDFDRALHIRDDVNVLMVSQGELYVPSGQVLTDRQVRALTQHEVGTHVLTHFNGSRQPLRLFAEGLADYDPLQEGLAVMAEYFCDSLSPRRMRTLAGRVLAGHHLLQGADFPEMFRALRGEAGMTEEEAFKTTARMFQGGGFLKDIVYLEGLVKLQRHLVAGGAYEPLLAGKFGIKHIPLVAELTERGILRSPALRPRYLMQSDFDKKLSAVRDGLPLYQLTS